MVVLDSVHFRHAFFVPIVKQINVKTTTTMKTKILTLIVLLSALNLFSCKKADDSIKLNSPTSIELNHEENYQISTESEHVISYSSDNEFHANVSQTGTVTANYVGETTIRLNNSHDTKTIKVTVAPRYTLYPTPSLEWGASKQQIISQYGTPDSQTTNMIGYTNYSSSAPIAMFTFDSSNRLESSAVLVRSSYSSSLSEYLLERYMPISVEGTTAIFVDALDSDFVNTVIGLSVYNLSYLMVIYTDASNSSSNTKVTEHSYRERLKPIIEQLIR